MARVAVHSPAVEAVRPYLDGVAKNLADKLYGPAGPPWGTRLTEIEDLLLELRDALTQEMLAQLLARQAAAGPQQAPARRTCPGCQQALACPGANPRIVQTRAGEAAWSEPEGYCRTCRQAFFPSVPEPG